MYSFLEKKYGGGGVIPSGEKEERFYTKNNVEE
jgi:hypothetical protein